MWILILNASYMKIWKRYWKRSRDGRAADLSAEQKLISFNYNTKCIYCVEWNMNTMARERYRSSFERLKKRSSSEKWFFMRNSIVKCMDRLSLWSPRMCFGGITFYTRSKIKYSVVNVTYLYSVIIMLRICRCNNGKYSISIRCELNCSNSYHCTKKKIANKSSFRPVYRAEDRNLNKNYKKNIMYFIILKISTN